MSVIRKKWYVCHLKWNEDGTGTLIKRADPFPTRQWALDELLKWVVEHPDAGYALVEVDDNPSWDSSSYGPRQIAMAEPVG